MSDTYELKAEARDRAGKGSARALRRQGKIPAVIYGDKKDPLSIVLPYKETHMKVRSPGFLSTLATIDLDGQKMKVLPKAFQADPVKEFTMHVDFLRIGRDTRVQVSIPLTFVNEDKAPGLTGAVAQAPEGEDAADAGEPVQGVLNIVRYDVEIDVAADSIPETIEVDLTGLDMDTTIHIGDLKLPNGAELTSNSAPEYAVVNIVAADSLASMEAEDEVEETEVLEQNADAVGDETDAAEAAPTAEIKDSEE